MTTRSELEFRLARPADLPAIVEMLADDVLGARREKVTRLESYQAAFAAIDADPNNELIVAESGNEIVGVAQLTLIPYLTYQGGWRALIEGVRVSSSHRAAGIGRRLIQWVIGRARERGCIMVQLTTDKSRPDAIGFYERIGFVASHEGMKMSLQDSQ